MTPATERQSSVSTRPLTTTRVPGMPDSTSDVRSGDPALKYGPSVSAGVGWPEHVAAAPGACILGATDLFDASGDGVETPACELAGVDPVQAASPTNKRASVGARLITKP